MLEEFSGSRVRAEESLRHEQYLGRVRTNKMKRNLFYHTAPVIFQDDSGGS